MKQYKHILLPVDFSKSNRIAAQRAKSIAAAHNAEITLVHVIGYLPPTYISVELPKGLQSDSFFLEKAKSRFAEWSDKRGLSNCNQLIEAGKPKKILLELLEDSKYDLVVLSPHDEAGLARVFGSVTNAVAQHCQCDVLIVKTE